MKVDVFKKLIKESVKEVIQEELKEILLEALKSNMGGKFNNPSPYDPPYKVTSDSSPIKSTTNLNVDLREKYNQALNETTLSFTTKDVPKFQPPSSTDTINGKLPDGDVDLGQIMGLLNN